MSKTPSSSESASEHEEGAQEGRFDPHARLVDPETGLEYKDFAAKLLGEPKKSWRNNAVRDFARRASVAGVPAIERAALEVFWRAYDNCQRVLDPKAHARWLAAGHSGALVDECFRPAGHDERERHALRAATEFLEQHLADEPGFYRSPD